MELYGLHRAELRDLIAEITSRTTLRKSLDDQLPELVARAAWSGIAEPGDSTAGALLAALGAPQALRALLERWTTTELCEALAAQGQEQSVLTPSALTTGIDRWRPRLNSHAVLGALRNAAHAAVQLVTPGAAEWPESLGDLGPHSPTALWVKGDPTHLERLKESISLVGARAATGYGEHVTVEAAAGLVDRGYAIVSGAAYGIDGTAHRSALASNGVTLAFLAGGVDRFYPSGHSQLLQRISETGAVISEVPCGTQPTKWRFLQRNRLIAAASQATVVIEAGWRSGSLNTAGHAGALGKPLGAVPGPVTSAASAGCHRLIREYDAVCVTTAEEMANLVESGTGPHVRDAERVPAAHTRVVDALSGRTPRPVTEIAARSGLSITEVQAVLGVLEIGARAAETERGWIKKAPHHSANGNN